MRPLLSFAVADVFVALLLVACNCVVRFCSSVVFVHIRAMATQVEQFHQFGQCDTDSEAKHNSNSKLPALLRRLVEVNYVVVEMTLLLSAVAQVPANSGKGSCLLLLLLLLLYVARFPLVGVLLLLLLFSLRFFFFLLFVLLLQLLTYFLSNNGNNNLFKMFFELKLSFSTRIV